MTVKKSMSRGFSGGATQMPLCRRLRMGPLLDDERRGGDQARNGHDGEDAVEAQAAGGQFVYHRKGQAWLSPVPSIQRTSWRTKGLVPAAGWPSASGIAGSFLVAELSARHLGFSEIFSVVAVAGLVATGALIVKEFFSPKPHGETVGRTAAH